MSIFKKITALFFILGLLLASTPSLTYAKQNDTIPEENIHIPIVKPKPKDSSQKASAASTQSIGYVDLWVSHSPTKINWKVVVYPPHKGNGFDGYLSITNLDSGFSHGRYPITKMKGALTPPIKKARYGGRLSGVLLYNGVTTGVTMESKYLVWEIK
ncbi:MAG TPA: hypothetical protein VNM45_04840 [Bacillus sp. (in: firmicutes)]|nr:hypothetical protein [Bacillus sp. (in: firmicutes)]